MAMMNSLGDFQSAGSLPIHAYSSVTSPTTSYTLPMSSLDSKPKSTIGYHLHNGYPTEATTPSSPIKVNGHGYSNHNHVSIAQSAKQAAPKEKATLTMDGMVHNLPQSMLNDQYGIAGYFVGYKASRARYIPPGPDALCTEVLAEMKAQNEPMSQPLYKRFSGPLGLPLEPESFSPDVAPGLPVYPEYLVTHRMIFESREPDMNYIRNTWALKIDKFGEDLLFYVFYAFPQDILQIAAANRLYQKGWRYHTEAKCWLQRMENGVYQKDKLSREQGVYNYFDSGNWKIGQIQLNLDTSKLEGAPKVPPDCFVPGSPKI